MSIYMSHQLLLNADTAVVVNSVVDDGAFSVVIDVLLLLLLLPSLKTIPKLKCSVCFPS